ncbi:IclR family transcriptional regulator [Paraburkholderia strydomiana]|uniref:IclR family transcriptional regulator n=1 Tax=Paraburkholderia strydomiana TaxID=1245417 RepID=UPI001BE735C2|nr:IclR family transcriptional regulator [Paraburkholderia strydomiana]MBT2789956.1 IclR family transcriptional regulator [Paraburkholderia strydomiana]
MPRNSETVRAPQGVTASGIDVLDRAASILFAFRRDDEPLTLTQLSERTGLYKSTLSRLAQALCHHQLLIRRDDGRFWIGSAAMHLSAVYEAGFDLRDVLLPAMKELSAETGEAVSFHVRERDHRVCLYRIASRHSIRAEVQQGDTQPLERGAGGRVLLAFAGEPGEPYETVRSRYVYLSMGERDRETSGISAPVFRVGQELVGALGIVGPSARMGMEQMERYRPRLLEFAARVTKALGGDPEPLLEAASLDAAPAHAPLEHHPLNDGHSDASGQTQANRKA